MISRRVGAHLRDQVLADQRRRHRVFVLHAVLVDAHLLQRPRVADAIPDEIVAAVARPQVVVEARDRIADHLLPLGQEEARNTGKMLAQRLRREVGLVRRAAPDVVAGIDRLHLRRDLRAHAGADAVAADQEVGALDAAVGEMHAHAALVLLDALEAAAEMVVRGIDGLAQQPLQPVPGGEDLPQRPLADDAAVAVEGDALVAPRCRGRACRRRSSPAPRAAPDGW